MHAEFDPRHTNSPLCACRDCNDAWLARRDRPVSKKHTFEIKRTLDPTKKKAYAARFADHGVYLSLDENMRAPSWRLMNTAKTWSTSTAFDVDLERLLRQLDEGRTFPQLDLTFHATPVVKSTASFDPQTGGPFCVMCGEPGGLPSPNMTGAAKLLGLRLFFEPSDARLGAARLHPGRCRKRLRQLLDTAKLQRPA